MKQTWIKSTPAAALIFYGTYITCTDAEKSDTLT